MSQPISSLMRRDVRAVNLPCWARGLGRPTSGGRGRFRSNESRMSAYRYYQSVCQHCPPFRFDRTFDLASPHRH